MSNYPGQLDTDAELPRVDDNVTEVSGEVINALREAIFAIQSSLGTSPQAAANTLKDRLAVSINDDGTLKSAALVISGIVNADVATTAGIVESKLDLDVPTQTLQDQITSNDIDIAALQNAINSILSDFGLHTSGLGLRHDTYDIDLNSAYPSSTPPEFTSLTSVNLHEALVEINDRYLDHVGSSKQGAHPASSVSVVDNFQTITADTTQGALEALDAARAVELIAHRDDLHANGITRWSNSQDGYAVNQQIYPTTLGATTTVTVVPLRRNVVDFGGVNLIDAGVTQGDVVFFPGPSVLGNYLIDDVGPRTAVGAKLALEADQLEVVGVIPDGYDGYTVEAQIFSPSSIGNFSGAISSTIYQNGIAVDSVLMSRPNAARIVSLGFNADLLNASQTLTIQAGVGGGTTRSLTVGRFDLGRITTANPISLDSVVERLNSVFQNRNDGYAFPVAAYRIGNELMLSHNWDESLDYTLSLQASTGDFAFGFDGYGADAVGKTYRPTQNTYFYVNGFRYERFATILETTADVSGSLITFTGLNPLETGIKIGHIVHLKDLTVGTERGSYFVANVLSNSIQLSHTPGLTADTGVTVQIVHDALPLNDFNTSVRESIVDVFVDENARVGYNERLSYPSVISNLKIVRVSDNFIESSYTLASTSVTGGVSIQLGAGEAKILPTNFTGEFRLYSPANMEFIDLIATGVIGVGAQLVTVNEPINEEEVFEIGSVVFDGQTTLSDVSDKRMFGTTGLDEIREDVIQIHVETPLAELRSNGVVRGLDVDSFGALDPAVYPSNEVLQVRGGTVYVAGVRCDVPTAYVPMANTSGTYLLVLDKLGTFSFIDEIVYPYDYVLDGYVGEVAPIASVVHDGANIISVADRRFFINQLDFKVEAIVDTTNRRIGSFGSVESALAYLDYVPHDQALSLRIVSKTSEDITINSSREISVILDGSVNNVTIQSPCRLLAGGPRQRVGSHIAGNCVISSAAGRVILDNIHVSGAVISTSGTELAYRDCNFHGPVLDDSSTRIEMVGCSFETDGYFEGTSTAEVRASNSLFISGGLETISAVDSDMLVVGCEFTLPAATLISASSRTLITGCVFDGFGATSTVSAVDTTDGNVETAQLDACQFNDVSQTTGTMVSLKEETVTSNSLFKNIIVGATADVLSGGSVNHCLFDQCQYSTTTDLTCDKFSENVFTNSIGDPLIAARSVSNNDGIGAVSVSDNDHGVIHGNRFAEGTNAYMVSVGNSGTYDLAPRLTISNNIFEVGSTQTGVLIASSTINGVNISNNHFLAVGGVGTGINLANGGTGAGLIGMESMIFGNTFEVSIPITTSAAISKLNVEGNLFNSTSNSFITIGANFRFCGNLDGYRGSNITFSGSTAGPIHINYNLMPLSEITFNAIVTADGTISGNRFSTIALERSLTGVVISDNLFDCTNTQTTTFTDCKWINNTGTSWDWSDITWSRSVISNNRLRSSGGMSVRCDNSSSFAGVKISDNDIGGGISLTSSTSTDIVGVVISGNSTSSASASISSGNVFRRCVISDNVNIGVFLTGGASDTVVSNNRMNITGASGTRLSVRGTIEDVIVSDNAIDVLQLQGDAFNNLTISNNIVDGAVEFAMNVGSSISNSVFSNNTIGGDFSNELNNVCDIDNTIFEGNNITGELYLNLEDGATPHSFQDNKFLNNTVTDVTWDFGPGTTVANNMVDGNHLNRLLIQEPTLTADVVVSELTVRNNRFEGSSGVLEAALSGITLQGAYILNNYVQSNIDLAFRTLSVSPQTDRNIAIEGNHVFGDIAITYAGALDRNQSFITIKDNVLTYDNAIVSGKASLGKIEIRSVGSGLNDVTIDQLVVSDNVVQGIYFQMSTGDVTNPPTLTITNAMIQHNMVQDHIDNLQVANTTTTYANWHIHGNLAGSGGAGSMDLNPAAGTANGTGIVVADNYGFTIDIANWTSTNSVDNF